MFFDTVDQLHFMNLLFMHFFQRPGLCGMKNFRGIHTDMAKNGASPWRRNSMERVRPKCEFFVGLDQKPEKHDF